MRHLPDARSGMFRCQRCDKEEILLMEDLCRACWRAREAERDPLAAAIQAATDAENEAEEAARQERKAR